ncbi:hypothetical protein ABLG96_15305 [Nakamurella sp. A5-74]|uniref:Uncharacterized protein n=1 Tax=Nakamurella sp. A5-74 TaxID=3158264 RepID=A0AAU8DMZ9_9ACTN
MTTGPLQERHGSARRPDRPSEHPRPDGVSDATVSALGKLSAALEVVEDARGALYHFHRLSGMADLNLQEAIAELRDAGHTDLADDIDHTLVGRDIGDGRWTFQIAEACDAQYWSVFHDVDRHARESLGLQKHVFEAEMKTTEQQDGAQT